MWLVMERLSFEFQIDLGFSFLKLVGLHELVLVKNGSSITRSKVRGDRLFGNLALSRSV